MTFAFVLISIDFAEEFEPLTHIARRWFFDNNTNFRSLKSLFGALPRPGMQWEPMRIEARTKPYKLYLLLTSIRRNTKSPIHPI